MADFPIFSLTKAEEDPIPILPPVINNFVHLDRYNGHFIRNFTRLLFLLFQGFIQLDFEIYLIHHFSLRHCFHILEY